MRDTEKEKNITDAINSLGRIFGNKNTNILIKTIVAGILLKILWVDDKCLECVFGPAGRMTDLVKPISKKYHNSTVMTAMTPARIAVSRVGSQGSLLFAAQHGNCDGDGAKHGCCHSIKVACKLIEILTLI